MILEDQGKDRYRMTQQKGSGGGLGTHSENRKAVSPDRLRHGTARVEGIVADQVILGDC